MNDEIRVKKIVVKVKNKELELSYEDVLALYNVLAELLGKNGSYTYWGTTYVYPQTIYPYTITYNSSDGIMTLSNTDPNFVEVSKTA